MSRCGREALSLGPSLGPAKQGHVVPHDSGSGQGQLLTEGVALKLQKGAGLRTVGSSLSGFPVSLRPFPLLSLGCHHTWGLGGRARAHCDARSSREQRRASRRAPTPTVLEAHGELNSRLGVGLAGTSVASQPQEACALWPQGQNHKRGNYPGPPEARRASGEPSLTSPAWGFQKGLEETCEFGSRLQPHRGREKLGGENLRR